MNKKHLNTKDTKVKSLSFVSFVSACPCEAGVVFNFLPWCHPVGWALADWQYHDQPCPSPFSCLQASQSTITKKMGRGQGVGQPPHRPVDARANAGKRSAPWAGREPASPRKEPGPMPERSPTPMS